jgi:hypothetical protein
LQNLLKDPKLSHVPKFAKDAAEKSCATLHNIETEAKDKLLRSSPADVSWTVDGLSDTCKAAQLNATLLDDCLKTARKHTC